MTVFDAVVADAELARTGITRVKRARFDALRLATERKILIVATISLLVNSSFVVYIYIYIKSNAEYIEASYTSTHTHTHAHHEIVQCFSLSLTQHECIMLAVHQPPGAP